MQEIVESTTGENYTKEMLRGIINVEVVTDSTKKNLELRVAAENGATTTLPVPNDPTIYTVSGNNYSGYIVTITRG